MSAGSQRWLLPCLVAALCLFAACGAERTRRPSENRQKLMLLRKHELSSKTGVYDVQRGLLPNPEDEGFIEADAQAVRTGMISLGGAEKAFEEAKREAARKAQELLEHEKAKKAKEAADALAKQLLDKENAKKAKEAADALAKQLLEKEEEGKRLAAAAAEKARQAAKLAAEALQMATCASTLFKGGSQAHRMCMPKQCSGLPSWATPAAWKEFDSRAPVCVGNEAPCQPYFIHIPSFPFKSRMLPKCPSHCTSGSLKTPALCLPKSARGLKLDGVDMKQLQECPDCVEICYPEMIKDQFAKLPGAVRISQCKSTTEGCSKSTKKVCIPPELRVIKSIQRLQDVVPLCGRCEELCVAKYIKIGNDNKALTDKLAKCDQPKCAGETQPAVCLPKEMQGLNLSAKLGSFANLLVPCTDCQTPCLPREILSLLPPDVSSVLNIPACHDEAKCKGINKRAPCLPIYFNTLKLPDGLEQLKHKLPTCPICTQMCVPSFVKITGTAGKAFESLIPTCAKPEKCKKSPEAPAVCAPPALKAHVAGFPQGAECPECADMCLPPVWKDTLSIPDWVNVPPCLDMPPPTTQCASVKYEFCLPASMRFIAKSIPALAQLKLKTCGSCTAMCVPSIIKLGQLPHGLEKVITQCPSKCSTAGRASPAVCLPKELKGVSGIPPALAGLLETCPDCVKPCLPSGMNLGGIEKHLNVEQCDADCGANRKEAFCAPTYLRLLLQKIPGVSKLGIKPCAPCTDACLPPFVSLPPGVPAGLLKTCKQTFKCPKQQPPSMCIPAALAGMKLPGTERLVTCPACTRACLPAQIKAELNLPSTIKIDDCPSKATDGCGVNASYAVCIPSHFRHVKLGQGFEALKPCPKCTLPCLPAAPKITLPFNLEFKTCPAPQCSGTMKKTLCIPPEFALLNISSLHALELKVCGKCETTCIPSTLRNLQLPMGVTFPSCVSSNMQGCTEKDTKHAVCLPPEIAKLKVTVPGMEVLSVCPRCTEPCVPESLPVKLPGGVKIKACPTSECPSTTLKMCMPKAYEHLNVSALKSLDLQACEPCERPCIPEMFRTMVPPQLKLPTCPPAGGPVTKKCKTTKHAVCIPAALGKLEFPGRQYLELCPSCTNPCMPKYLAAAVKLPGGVSLPACPVDQCSVVKSAMCLPEELTLLRVPELAQFQLPTCKKCQQPCMPPGLNVPLPFGIQIPKCASDALGGSDLASCDRVKHALCLPASISTINIKFEGSQYLQECPKCTSACVPQSLKSKLPKGVDAAFKTCPAEGVDGAGHKCKAIAHATCVPEAYSLLRIPEVEALGLQPCRVCQVACIPTALQALYKLPMGITFAACPDAGRTAESLGLPEGAKVLPPESATVDLDYNKGGKDQPSKKDAEEVKAVEKMQEKATAAENGPPKVEWGRRTKYPDRGASEDVLSPSQQRLEDMYRRNTANEEVQFYPTGYIRQ